MSTGSSGSSSSNSSNSNSNNNSTSNKKAKKSNSSSDSIVEQIETVKQYLLSCPDVPSNSFAIQTSMKALDKELKRIERDEKLRLKFAKEQAESLNDEEEDDGVCVELSRSTELLRKNTVTATDDDAQLTEWQDVGSDAVQDKEMASVASLSNDGDVTPSPLGISLAQDAIASMSSADIQISTPVAALALAIHGALRSEILGFKCTGVPEEDNCFRTDSKPAKKKGNGFAAPVRELPKGKFIPDKWDKFSSSAMSQIDHRVTLRYRKDGVGAIILRVSVFIEEDISMVQVCFGPAGGEPVILDMPLDRHINIVSLNAALEKSGRVKPALHYKHLQLLISDFCQACDLGAVGDVGDVVSDATNGNTGGIPTAYTNYEIKPAIGQPIHTFTNQPTYGEYDYDRRQHPTIQDDLIGVGGIGNRPGDFANDLLPSGIPAPGFANPRLGGGPSGGNLMGPNHPAFHPSIDNDNGDFLTPGGLGMNPRFDPFYPPGVHINNGRGPGRGRGRGPGGRGRGRPGGRGGDPNPDHMRPPSNLGNNMFM